MRLADTKNEQIYLITYLLYHRRFACAYKIEDAGALAGPRGGTARNIVVAVGTNPGLARNRSWGNRLMVSQPSLPPRRSLTLLLQHKHRGSLRPHLYTMNTSSSLFARLRAHAPSATKQTARQFSRSSRRAANPAGSQPRGNARPTMEQLRAPFARDNMTVM